MGMVIMVNSVVHCAAVYRCVAFSCLFWSDVLCSFCVDVLMWAWLCRVGWVFRG